MNPVILQQNAGNLSKQEAKGNLMRELKQKYEALLKKQQGKAYIAEGKSWDDSDNDDTEEYGNHCIDGRHYRVNPYIFKGITSFHC